MADQEEKPKMTPEMIKNNHELAAQAALRAQQMLFRKSLGASDGSSGSASPSPSKKPPPPQVPARGDSQLSKQPPEIPPKRHSLKKAPGIDEINAIASRTPPPLPQKPSSAQNSPIPAPKVKDKTRNMNIPPGTPQMQNKFDRTAVPKPQNTDAPQRADVPISAISQNPFILRNSPQLNQRSNQSSASNSPHLPNSQRTAIAAVPLPKATIVTPAKKPISPIEDSSSEDALRGIESGIRNMERAMQEQINRAAAAQQAKQEQKINLNPAEFKRSAASLDGSSQNLNVIEAMRLTLSKTQSIRSMERGYSMDQMRIDSMNLSNMRSTLEEMKNSATNRPVENHMKSLDRNLPLELQYSRHHHNRSQSQQEMVDQMRQNLIEPNLGNRPNTGSLSRDDIRMRRRSSHDENQMAQAPQPNAPGKMKSFSHSPP